MEASHVILPSDSLAKKPEILKVAVCWLLILAAIYCLRTSTMTSIEGMLLSISFYLVLIAGTCGLLLVRSFKKGKAVDPLCYKNVFKFLYIEAIGGTVIMFSLIALAFGCIFNECRSVNILTSLGGILLMVCPLASLAYYFKATRIS